MMVRPHAPPRRQLAEAESDAGLFLELRTIDYVVGVVFVLIALLGAGAALLDGDGARDDPETYSRVYHTSAGDLIAVRYRTAALHAVSVALPMLMFIDRKRRRIWRPLTLGVAALWVVYVAYGYWSWAQTGFDH